MSPYPQVFIGQESLLSAYPPVSLLCILQEHLQLVALAEQVLPLGPGVLQFAVLLLQTAQARLNLSGSIMLFRYQRLQ